MSDKSIVTMAVLNKAYQDLYKRVIAIDSPWNILGDKTWTEFWSLTESDKGDTWNISSVSGMPSSITDVKVGSNLTCLQTYSGVTLTVDNWRTYWMATSGMNDIAKDDKAGLLKTRPATADTEGGTTEATVTRSLHLNSNNQGYVEIPMATTTSYGLVDVNAQSFAGDKTFKNNVTVEGTLTATIEGVSSMVRADTPTASTTPAITSPMRLLGATPDANDSTAYHLHNIMQIQNQSAGLKISGGVTTKTLDISADTTISGNTNISSTVVISAQTTIAEPLHVKGTAVIGTSSKTTTITSSTANGFLNIEGTNTLKGNAGLTISNGHAATTASSLAIKGTTNELDRAKVTSTTITGGKGLTIKNESSTTASTLTITGTTVNLGTAGKTTTITSSTANGSLNIEGTNVLKGTNTITGNAGLTLSNGHATTTASSLEIKNANTVTSSTISYSTLSGTSAGKLTVQNGTTDAAATLTVNKGVTLSGNTNGLTVSNGTAAASSLTISGANTITTLTATKATLTGSTGGLTITNNTTNSGAGSISVIGANTLNGASVVSATVSNTTITGNAGLTISNGHAATTTSSLTIKGTTNELNGVKVTSTTIGGNKGLTINGNSTQASTVNVNGTTVTLGTAGKTTTVASPTRNGILNVNDTVTLTGNTNGLTVSNGTAAASTLTVNGSNTVTTLTATNATLAGSTGGLTITNNTTNSGAGSVSVISTNTLNNSSIANSSLTSVSVSSATVNNATVEGYTKGITIKNGNSSTNSGNAASLTVTNTNTITSVTASNVTLTGNAGLTISNGHATTTSSSLAIYGTSNELNAAKVTSTTISGSKGLTINGSATRAGTINIIGTTVNIGTDNKTTTITSSVANGNLDINNSVTLTGGKGLTIKNGDSTTNASVLDVRGPGAATLAAGAKGLTITSDSSTTAASITLTGVTVDINNKINVDGNVDIDAALTITKALTVGTTDTGAVNIKSGGASATTIIGPNNGTINLPANSATAGYALVQDSLNTSSWLKYTNASTGNTLVKRDASGDFYARTVNADLSGTATNATNIGISSTTSKIYVVGVSATSGNNAAKVDTSVTITNGTLTATKVTNAVWNDLVDCIEVPEDTYLEYGYAYGFDGKEYKKTSKMADSSYIGIHSDTYGMAMGSKEGKKVLNVAVAGFVLAYVDRVYKVGTPLTTSPNGELTRARFLTRILHPERVVATFWKVEPSLRWGDEDNKIEVNGRNWVKIK